MPEFAEFVAKLREALGEATQSMWRSSAEGGRADILRAGRRRTIGVESMTALVAGGSKAARATAHYCAGCDGSCSGTTALQRAPALSR
ncbi:hypothetical protein AWB76_04828 [Caballeronia temeraria]|uniref:Uncharacterized protein n=1 Tax=Caballeronia temeraria TaxID=1777137 RepID=A0A158BY52_9BURK|nr:hypothetical protein AWB76_04828 [Caballeronia temeraria]